jgi:hypothetical protein
MEIYHKTIKHRTPENVKHLYQYQLVELDTIAGFNIIWRSIFDGFTANFHFDVFKNYSFRFLYFWAMITSTYAAMGCKVATLQMGHHHVSTVKPEYEDPHGPA